MAITDAIVELAAAYADELERAVRFLIAAGSLYGLARLLLEPAVERLVRQRNPGDETLHRAVMRHLRLLVVIGALVAGTIAAGYGGVVTGSNLVIAAATLAIGVAGQEVLGSLISGLFLVANADFNTGDWIRWGDREGEIVSIHFRTTRVRTVDNEVVTVPNTELTEESVVHRFSRDRLRLTQDVGITYESDVDEAIERLEATATDTESILATPRPHAYLLELDDEMVVLRLEYWIEYPSARTVAVARSALALAIVDAFEGSEIELGPASQYELDGHVDVSLTEAAD